MKLRIVMTMALAMSLWHSSHAQTIGSAGAMTDRYGSMFTFSAKTLKFPESYIFTSNKYFVGTGERFDGAATSKPSVKDYGLNIGINFGIFDNFDVIAGGNFAQQSNRPSSIPKSEVTSFFSSINVPQDFYLNFRWVPMNYNDGKIRMGFMLTRHFTGSNFPNVSFIDYATDSPEIGLAFIGSYFAKPMAEESGLIMNFNLQYRNHLDNGQYVGWRKESDVRALLNGDSWADTATVESNTSSLRYALGGTYPLIVGGRYLFLMGDLYGLQYLTKPPAAAYTRQSTAYLALGARYQILDWMGIHVGGDFRLFSGKEKTISGSAIQIEDLTLSKSDYPAWHVHAGLSFPLNPRSVVVADTRSRDIYARQSRIEKNEVKDILYSEQEIQKRSQNFVPLKEMRRNYKSIIGSLITVLEPMDKKPPEPEAPPEEESGNQ